MADATIASLRRPIVEGEITRLPLTRGQFALIDTASLPLVDSWSWRVSRKKNGRMYCSGSKGAGASSTMYLHRLLMGAMPGESVDHINSDALDNRMANLRLATQSQNNANNRKWRRPTTSRYKGVYFRQTGRCHWRGQLKLNGRYIWTGVFTSEREAAMAYNAKAVEVFGEYARLNEVPL